MTTLNRRYTPRFPIDISLGVFNQLRRQQIGVLRDLSEGGMKLCTDNRFPVNAPIMYWIRLPEGYGQRQWVALAGRVVWQRWNVEQRIYEHGLEISETCHNQLTRILTVMVPTKTPASQRSIRAVS